MSQGQGVIKKLKLYNFSKLEPSRNNFHNGERECSAKSNSICQEVNNL